MQNDLEQTTRGIHVTETRAAAPGVLSDADIEGARLVHCVDDVWRGVNRVAVIEKRLARLALVLTGWECEEGERARPQDPAAGGQSVCLLLNEAAAVLEGLCYQCEQCLEAMQVKGPQTAERGAGRA